MNAQYTREQAMLAEDIMLGVRLAKEIPLISELNGRSKRRLQVIRHTRRGPKTQLQLAGLLGVNKITVVTDCRALVGMGLLTQVGQGTKGNPFLYEAVQ